MTDFKLIEYDPIAHTYMLGDQQLVSVTTLLARLKPMFDSAAVSTTIAARRGITKEEVLAEWELKGKLGRDRGTRLHLYAEDVIIGKIDPILYNVNDKIPEMQAFDAVWNKLRKTLDAQVVKQEWTIGDAQFGVAGRLDVLLSTMIDGERKLSIFDWKTGKMRTDNQYQRMLPPFDDEDDCELVHYSLQTSLYRLILERNKPDVVFGDSYLVHLRDDGSYLLHRAIDYRQKWASWLDNGIPPFVFSDPVCTKKASDISSALLSIDDKLLARVADDVLSELSQRLHNAYRLTCRNLDARSEV